MAEIRIDWIHCYVYRINSDDTFEVLLLQRASRETIYPDLWQVITGGIEKGETAYAAARRELEEETSIRASELIILPYVGSFYAAKFDAVELLPSFACRVDAQQEIQLSHEHQAYCWCTPSQALETLVFPSQKEGIGILRDFIVFPKPNYPLNTVRF